MDDKPTAASWNSNEMSPSSIFFEEGHPSHYPISVASDAGNEADTEAGNEADNEASSLLHSRMSDDDPPEEYRPPGQYTITSYEYQGDEYHGQTDTFIIGSDASNILKEADPPIPCVLWGIMLRYIFEHEINDSSIPTSVDLVVEDEQVKDAIEILRKAGFKDDDNYPGCPYNGGACPVNELKPVHVFHLFDSFSHTRLEELANVTKGPQLHHDLRLHCKSNVYWKLPKFTVQTEANEADENFMLSLDRRLRWEGVHRPNVKDHPPTKNPLVLPTPARFAEALVYLKVRDEHFKITEIDWEEILKEHFKPILYVAHYGAVFELDAKRKTLSETCREWWESCRTGEYTSITSTKLLDKLEKEIRVEMGVSGEPEPIPLDSHWGQENPPDNRTSVSPRAPYSTDDEAGPFRMSESDRAVDTDE
ncbi:similar to An13g01740 [Aspergillus tubingensis]|uniref:similar to An13g01740 n=1 Tax=Aspergillus tubingensis TaxID=5068 RepID=UPI0015784193|nr:similar to An13g01740 [Aspergillus tubingensis]GFN14132.1 similar to An13g01740 [Aspergillus tubingensis]